MLQLAPTGCRSSDIVQLAFLQPVQDVAGRVIWDLRLFEQHLDKVVSARIVPTLLMEHARSVTVMDRAPRQVIEKPRRLSNPRDAHNDIPLAGSRALGR